jgi:hypothetical protein
MFVVREVSAYIEFTFIGFSFNFLLTYVKIIVIFPLVLSRVPCLLRRGLDWRVFFFVDSKITDFLLPFTAAFH